MVYPVSFGVINVKLLNDGLMVSPKYIVLVVLGVVWGGNV